MRIRTFAMAAAAVLALTAAAAADPADKPTDKPGKCFVTTSFNSWKAAGDHTIYIRVGVRDIYRLDLANRCSALTAIDPHLVTRWRGSNWVCTALDWDLKVSRGFGIGAEACIVKAMTPLTRAEADAIPRNVRP